MGLKAVLPRQRRTVVSHRHGQKMILNVRIANAGARPDETAAFEVIGGAEPVLAQQPAGTDQGAAQRPDGRVQGDGLLASHLKVELQMILKILAHAAKVCDDLDPELAQLGGRTHSRHFEQLRRGDRAAAQDELAADIDPPCGAAAPVLQRDRALAVEHDARRQ